jgi:hypothetical protein
LHDENLHLGVAVPKSKRGRPIKAMPFCAFQTVIIRSTPNQKCAQGEAVVELLNEDMGSGLEISVFRIFSKSDFSRPHYDTIDLNLVNLGSCSSKLTGLENS